MAFMNPPIPYGKLPRSEKPSARSEKSSERFGSDVEEAQALVRRCAEPCPAGDKVKAAILRACRQVDLPFERTRDLWYGEARRINAEEMDKLREAAASAEIARAVAGIEVLRCRLAGSTSPASREVVAGLDAALRALGRDPRRRDLED